MFVLFVFQVERSFFSCKYVCDGIVNTPTQSCIVILLFLVFNCQKNFFLLVTKIIKNQIYKL